METTLTYLTYLGVVLLIGLLMSLLSKKLKVPPVLLLLLSGIGLANLKYKGEPLMTFDPNFLVGVAILALVMIVFEGSSKFKWREFDSLSFTVLKLIIIFLVLNVALLSTATYYIMGLESVYVAVIFAIVMTGTDPGTVLSLFKTGANRIIEILRIEAILNTPLIVLLPFLLIDAMNLDFGIVSKFVEQLVPFLQQIITGVGAGVVLGIVVFKLMKKFYSEDLSPLALMVTALLGYVLAENLGGNGVLAVTTLGFMFGNMYLKGKTSLKEFSNMFSNALEILVFILLGFMVPIVFSVGFLIKSLIIFIILLLIRHVAILISFRREKNFTIKNKIFMTLNISKGIAIAVLVLALSLKNVPRINFILDLTLVMIIYSIVLSTIVGKLSKYFIKIDVNKKCQ